MNRFTLITLVALATMAAVTGPAEAQHGGPSLSRQGNRRQSAAMMPGRNHAAQASYTMEQPGSVPLPPNEGQPTEVFGAPEVIPPISPNGYQYPGPAPCVQPCCSECGCNPCSCGNQGCGCGNQGCGCGSGCYCCETGSCGCGCGCGCNCCGCNCCCPNQHTCSLFGEHTVLSHCCCLFDRVYGGAEWLTLRRHETGDASRNLIYGDNNASQNVMIQPITRPQSVALSTADLEFDWEEALRITAGLYVGPRGARVEARYFQLDEDDWTAMANLAMGDYSLGTQLQNNNQNPNAVNIDTTVASVQNLLTIMTVQAQRESDVRGFEVNYFGETCSCDCHWRWNPIFGMRGFLLDEMLTMNMTSGGGAILYESTAENRLIGLQVGGELGYDAWRSGMYLGTATLSMKGGLAGNLTNHTITINNADPTNNPDAPDDSEIVISPFAEVAARIEVHVGPVIVHAGYEAVVIGNVELGGVPPELFIIGGDVLSPNDTVVYHGASAGAMIRF